MKHALPMILLFACATTPPIERRPRGPANDTDTDTAVPDTDLPDTDPPAVEPCPDGMVLVADRVCVDRFEAALEQWVDGTWVPASPYLTVDERQVRAVPADGIVPQAYISGEEAAAACEAAGKRLCRTDEWLEACQGPQGWTFPYGPAHRAGACNDTYGGTHPVVDYFGRSTDIWDPVHMNDPGINQQPGTVAAGGEYPDCVSAWAVHDLHGNLHEWVADSEGIFRGGFFADAAINGPGCLYRTTAHGRRYHDYSTGFRCCAEPR